ncbi:MAG: GHKL domain-containing protein [Acidobacteria bacterium]|nr:GHKL domain-containing protein [Acidobacteriota bacterium]
MMSNPTQLHLKIKLRSIITYLSIGFALLLILIWFVATISQNKLEQLRIQASENSQAYLERLELATGIREAASNVIAQARLYRAARDIGVPGVPYRFNLNKSKYGLERLLKKGDKLWGENPSGLPAGEVAAWLEIEGAIGDLWKQIEIEEKKPEETGGQQAAVVMPVPGPVSAPGAAAQQQDTTEGFYEKRSAIEQAALRMAEEIAKGRRGVFEEITQLQNRAANEIGRARWLTLLFGLGIAGLTLYTTQKQLNRLRDAERRLQEEQGRKGAIFDSLSNDILVLSKQGEVLEVNHAFRDHFNMTDAELKLQDYHAALAHVPEIATFVGGAVQNPDFVHRQRERIEVKSRIGQLNNSLFDVSVFPLHVGDETEGRVIVLDDVTEDERVREELRRSRTLSAVGQITAQVAHEIYNPLGAVKLNLELLEMQIGEDEDIRHTIGRIKRGVEHLSTIAMDLRFLTRPRDPERKPTDLSHLLDDVIELASDRLERSRIVVTRDFVIDPPEGEFDQQQLRKVFLNLLINAIEASSMDGEIELRTTVISAQDSASLHDLDAPQGAVVVSVIDHGTGMSEETRSRIFEAFFTTKRNGTGLGMMITQEIVKKHKGKIEIDSEEGKGTRVDVLLPL